MGYYTWFTIKIEDCDTLLREEVDHLNDSFLSNFDTLLEHGQKIYQSDPRELYKWYGWKDELANISFCYPRLKFTLTGNGEDNDDMWIAYAHQGTVQVEIAKITYDPCKLW